MKKFSKLFALLLAAVMLVVLAVPAFAANEVPHTITLSYEKPGHSYDAYQIFKGDLSDGKLIHIEWGAGVNGEALLAALKADETLAADFGAEVTTAEQVAKILTDYEDDSAKLEIFGRLVAANLTAIKAGTSVQSAAGDIYEYAIDVIGDGYYIVMESSEVAADDAATKYILQVLGDVSISAKADAPTLDKKILEDGQKVELNEVFVGDVVNYVLSSKVPKMEGYNKYFFVINDTMSKGLTFNGDVAVKIGGNALTAGTDYVVESEDIEEGTAIRIIFKNFIARKAQAGQAIEVTYSATLNEQANIGEIGNPNTANLVYSNNPNEDGIGEPEKPDVPSTNDDDVIGKTPDSTVVTYTSGIKLIKVDSEGNTLTGAKFKIEGVAEKVVIISEKIFRESENGTFYRLVDGTYTEVAPTEQTKDKYDDPENKYEEITVVTKDTVKTDIVTEAWVDANGVITFAGLGEGEFTITEIEAPEGYNKLTQPINIVINFDENGTPKWTATRNGTEMELDGNLFVFQVENKAGATLPTTGGIGTKIFYIMGAVLVVGAAVVLIAKKRVADEA